MWQMVVNEHAQAVIQFNCEWFPLNFKAPPAFLHEFLPLPLIFHSLDSLKPDARFGEFDPKS